MTISELIEALREHNQTARVEACFFNNGNWQAIDIFDIHDVQVDVNGVVNIRLLGPIRTERVF